MLPTLCPGTAWKLFFLPVGHRAVQTLHEACHALKNSECHCGIISLGFNVTHFLRTATIRVNLGLVTAEGVCAGTRRTCAAGFGVAHGSRQPLTLAQTFGSLGTSHTEVYVQRKREGRVPTCVLISLNCFMVMYPEACMCQKHTNKYTNRSRCNTSME